CLSETRAMRRLSIATLSSEKHPRLITSVGKLGVENFAEGKENQKPTPLPRYQVLYPVPSVPVLVDADFTSLMPGSCWSTDKRTSSCTTSQFASLVIGSLGITLR